MNFSKEKISEQRRQLLKNGYSPIPNRDKACYLTNWPKIAINDDIIHRWGRMHGAAATGLRVENDLCVIDVDVDHDIVDDVCDAMLAQAPEGLHVNRLERYSHDLTGKKRYKLAWYVRTEELFSRLHTRRWTAPDETEDDGTHSVEIFGGASPRQFGSFGPHTIDDECEATVVYKWEGESPLDVALDKLVFVPKQTLFAMLDAAEGVLRHQGFEAVARTTSGEGAPGRVYDLTSEMSFDLHTGETVSYDELNVMVNNGWTGRCSASWLEGAHAINRQRCLVSKSGAGHVAIWESAEGNTHMPAMFEPPDRVAQVDRVAEKLRERQDKRRTQLNDGDDHITGAAKLLGSYAYMVSSKNPIIPLWTGDECAGLSMTNFRTYLSPYCGIEVGPRGGEKKLNPLDIWLANPNRLAVDGLRMRPDMERPTFNEQGQTFVNTYHPPELGPADGGDPQGGLNFLKQLVPDDRERRWFTQWLAHKWRYPFVPGPAVIMVAREFGTGRGTFGDLLKLLFGNRYVVPVPFAIFSGKAYQAQYTSWALNALIAIVNESNSSNGGSIYKAKQDVYEHLKDLVEPRPTERTYILHGVTPVRAISSMSAVIMTNHADTLPLPSDDRRFVVLTNGEKRDLEFWEYINAWMRHKPNLAAFAEYLDAVDLEGYSPYEVPLATLAKEEMTELNETPLDRILATALGKMEEYFVPEQVLRKMANIVSRKNVELPPHWQVIAEKEMRRIAWAVRYPTGRKVSPMIGGERYEVLHMDKKKAKAFHNTVGLRVLLKRNGDVFNETETLPKKS